MAVIRKKLHSQSGASFLFAVLAFLVAAMVSVTIIAAAVTNVKRIHSDRAAQQAHLTLSSAAQLIREEMEKTTCTIITTTVTGADGKSVSQSTYEGAGTFDDEMKTAVEQISLTLTDYSGSFTIETNGLDMDQVDVSFIVKTDAEAGEKYDVIFTLSLNGSEETLFLLMKGTKTDPVDISGGGEDVWKTKEVVSWKNGIINGIGES